MDISKLKKYHGYQSSITPFSSQYYFYLASWDNTPTGFPQFSNIWLITPEDHRILFADPPESSDIVCLYHDFHEIHGSSILVEWISENHLHLHCASLNGLHKLEVDFLVKETLSSKLLIAMAGGPPTPFRMSKPMLKISDFLVNQIVSKGGSTIAGVTETGQPFYHGETERLFQITQCSAVYNGMDLGGRSKPTWPIAFGDAVPFVVPTIKLGTLYIPYEQAMMEDRASRGPAA